MGTTPQSRRIHTLSAARTSFSKHANSGQAPRHTCSAVVSRTAAAEDQVRVRHVETMQVGSAATTHHAALEADRELQHPEDAEAAASWRRMLSQGCFSRQQL